jgi:hypothetical protein
MTPVHPEASRQAVVEAALVLLERMGLSPADLAAVPQPRRSMPTFAEYDPCCGDGYRQLSPGADLGRTQRKEQRRGSRRSDMSEPKAADPVRQRTNAISRLLATNTQETRSQSSARSSRATPSPSGSPAALTKPLNYWHLRRHVDPVAVAGRGRIKGQPRVS